MSKTEIAKKDEPAAVATLGISNLPAFDQDEIASGGEAQAEGYIAQYPFMVSTDGDEFVIKSTAGDGTEVTRQKTLRVIAFYGHKVYRLHQGHVNGLTTDMSTWSDEDRAIVAQSYGDPFGRLHKSRGNFDALGLSQYLDNADLRRGVKKRLYLFVAVDGGVLPKGSIAACTFGSSALKPWQDYNSAVQREGAPVSFILTELSLKRVKNDAGQSYAQIVFNPARDDKGAVVVPWKEKAQWQQVAGSLLAKIKATHQTAVEMAEEYRPSVSEPAPVASHAGADVVDGQAGFEDETIPW